MQRGPGQLLPSDDAGTMLNAVDCPAAGAVDGQGGARAPLLCACEAAGGPGAMTPA